MNNKGFTLIELIATIALLAIIAVISYVSISGVLESTKTDNCITLVNNITSSVKEYVSDNRYNINGINSNITLNDLVNNSYVSLPIVDPYSKKEINPSKINIAITLNSDYSAKEITIKVNNVKVDCNNKNVFKNVIK